MTASFKRFFAILLGIALLLPVLPSAKADFEATVSVFKIGLYQSTDSGTVRNFVSANLENYSGAGYGYDIGYFNEDREFVPLGASITDTMTVTVTIDKNVVWDQSSRAYKEGTEGDVQVGCFHIQIATRFSDYGSALDFAKTLNVGANVFIKFSSEVYYVCIGEYISAAAATDALSWMDIPYSTEITSGTPYTVSVVETATDRILFEFEYNGKYDLALHPRVDEEGVKAITYHRGYRYYGDFSFVRPYSGNIFVVNYVGIEDYVAGVLPYEMSASWPLEALKAQAVSARTYAMKHLNKHSAYGFDICNTTDCQVYRGMGSANENSNRAVAETAGMYLTYQGELCETYYYSCNGGASESIENVWTQSRDYLIGVYDPYEADIADSLSSYNYTITYTGAQLAERLQARGYNAKKIVSFEIEFTAVGNVKKVKLIDSNGTSFTFTGDNCRTVLGTKSLRYTINDVKPNSNMLYVNNSYDWITGALTSFFAEGSGGVGSLSSEVYAINGRGELEVIGGDNNKVTAGTFVIKGSGHGHNVGMSQWGAYSMAKYHAKDYIEILTFYYQGTDIVYSVKTAEDNII